MCYMVSTQIFPQKRLCLHFLLLLPHVRHFGQVYYRFSTVSYGMLPHLGNIHRKPRVTCHNPSLGGGIGGQHIHPTDSEIVITMF